MDNYVVKMFKECPKFKTDELENAMERLMEMQKKGSCIDDEAATCILKNTMVKSEDYKPRHSLKQ